MKSVRSFAGFPLRCSAPRRDLVVGTPHHLVAGTGARPRCLERVATRSAKTGAWNDPSHSSSFNRCHAQTISWSLLDTNTTSSCRWKRVHRLSIRTFSNAKRHKWTRTELTEVVNELIALIRDKNSSQSTRKWVVDSRETLNVNFCFDVLEACMEVAKEYRDITAAHRARSLLLAMEANIFASQNSDAAQNFTLAPSTSFYDVVLQSYAVCGGGSEAAFAAQAILERMIQQCGTWLSAGDDTSGSQPPPEPTVKSFNIVVNAWAKSRHKEAGQRAQTVVEWMDKWNVLRHDHEGKRSNHPYKGAAPDLRTLVSLVDAWSKSRHPQAPQHATNILIAPIEESKRNHNFTLDPILFHVVLGAWANSRAGRRAGEGAEEILSIMEKCATWVGRQLLPGTRAYALVMEAWMQCEQVEKRGNAAKRAEFLLRSMVDSYRSGRELYIKPNKMCFTTCISAWSRATLHNDALEHAEALLDLLIDLYKETQDDAFRPDAEVFNAVIAAWTRATNRPGSMDRAKECLARLREYDDPDLVTFNTILDGMGKRGMGEDAMKLVEWLEHIGRSTTRLVPDIISYNSTLSALARDKTCSRPWERALNLLKRMEEMAGTLDGKGVRPDQVSYTIAVGAWLGETSLDIAHALQAQELVARSIQNHQELGWKCKPDSHVFASLLQVCAKVQGSALDCERALDIALRAMEDCQSGSYGEASHVALASGMKAVDSLCRDEARKSEILKLLFEETCRSGQVSKQVVAAMMASGVWNDDKIPAIKAEWSRRVPPQSKP